MVVVVALVAAVVVAADSFAVVVSLAAVVPVAAVVDSEAVVVVVDPPFPLIRLETEPSPPQEQDVHEQEVSPRTVIRAVTADIIFINL